MTELRNYVRYASNNPRLNFTFLYPSDWQLGESSGINYDEVTIIGPRNQENTYSLGLSVKVSLPRSKGGQFPTLEELVADYLAKSQRLAGFQKLSQAQGYLAEGIALEVEISYVIPLPINTIHPKDTPIVERRISFKRSNYFYEVVYRAVEEDYPRYLEAFKSVIRTFESQNDAARRAYQPLVIPVPAYAVREQSAAYGETD